MFLKKCLDGYYKKQLLVRSQTVSALVEELENYIDKKQVELIDYKVYLRDALNRKLFDLQQEYKCEEQFFYELDSKLLVHSQLYFEKKLAYKQKASIELKVKLLYEKHQLINYYQQMYGECIREGNELIDILSKESDFKNHLKLISIQNHDCAFDENESLITQYGHILKSMRGKNQYISEVRFLLQDIWRANSAWQKELNTLKICCYQCKKQQQICKEARGKVRQWSQGLKREIEEIEKNIEDIKIKENESREEVIDLWKNHIKKGRDYLIFQDQIDYYKNEVNLIKNHKENLYQKMNEKKIETKSYKSIIKVKRQERNDIYFQMEQHEQSKKYFIVDNQRLNFKKNDLFDRLNTAKINLNDYYSMKNDKWETINYYKERHESVPDFESKIYDIHLYERKILEYKEYIEDYKREIGEIKSKLENNQEQIDRFKTLNDELFAQQGELKREITYYENLISQNEKECEELMQLVEEDKEKIGRLYMIIQEQKEEQKKYFYEQIKFIKDLLIQCKKLLD